MAWRSGSLSRTFLNAARSPVIRPSAGNSAAAPRFRRPSSPLLPNSVHPSRRLSFTNPRCCYYPFRPRILSNNDSIECSRIIAPSLLINFAGILLSWVGFNRWCRCTAWWRTLVWLPTLLSTRGLVASCLRVPSDALVKIANFSLYLFVDFVSLVFSLQNIELFCLILLIWYFIIVVFSHGFTSIEFLV